ncbi:MAG: hypothetical protein ACKO5F_08770 [Synechococcus sp.]
MSPSAARTGRLLRVVGINALILLLGLGLVELALRGAGVRHPAFYRPDPIRGYSLRPGASGFWTREGRGSVTINSDGLRDVEHRRARQPGVLRVAVLGDSFSEALQVNLEDTWWKQLERGINAQPGCALRRGFPGGVEIINFGVGGYGTGLELLTWRQQARRYAPELVLLAMYLGNDIEDNTPQARPDLPVFRFAPDGSLTIDRGFLQSPGSRLRFSPIGRLVDALVGHSALLQLANEAKNRAAASRNGHARPDLIQELNGPPDPSQGWAMTAALLRTLREEVSASGAQLLVTSLSTPAQVYPDQALRRRLLPGGGPGLFAREQRLQALLDPLGVTYLPLAPDLQQRADRQGLSLHGFPGQQPGLGHWNQQGHRLAAELLAERLCTLAPVGAINKQP